MKAPEKIYLHHNHKGDIGAGWLMFPLTNNDIEYVRTDTLEVKEVDLEKEIEQYVSGKGLRDYGFLIPSIAKHFFELGLKAQKGE